MSQFHLGYITSGVFLKILFLVLFWSNTNYIPFYSLFFSLTAAEGNFLVLIAVQVEGC